MKKMKKIDYFVTDTKDCRLSIDTSNKNITITLPILEKGRHIKIINNTSKSIIKKDKNIFQKIKDFFKG